MLSPTAAGNLSGGHDAVTSVSVPLNAARFQGRVSVGGVDDLFVWGSGTVGKLTFEPALDGATDILIRPNCVTYTLPGGTVRLTALSAYPALVVEFTGVPGSVRLAPTRTAQPGLLGRFELSTLDDGWVAHSPWAAAALLSTGGTSGRNGRVTVGGRGLVVLGLGGAVEEASGAVTAVMADPQGALRTANGYAASLEDALQTDDALLKSMFAACLHAAHSCRKELPSGRFAGFSAGTGYVMPPRTYFRDSYWTVQALLPFTPGAAVEQLRLLAPAVADDGETPSGVITASEAGSRVWEARVAADPNLAAAHSRPGQWWSDHFDSPYYFVLLARDALTWSLASGEGTAGPGPGGREAALAPAIEETVDGVSLAEKIVAVLERGRRLAGAGSLPVKPFHDRDWADNVFRHGFVTYDVALYHGALEAGAALLAGTRPEAATRYRATAAAVRAAATERLFDSAAGHFVEFLPAPGSAASHLPGETHLTLDSLVALRTGLASPAQARSSLAAAGRILETRNNRQQPYGDWGVMSTFPPYRATTRRRGKSRFAYRYHNGSDWPYLDGIYAEALLAAGSPAWRYALTRWFEFGLAQGWPTPVEYYAPPWGRGSPLNGWSSMPAAAMLLGGFGLRPTGPPRLPPWGACTLTGVLVDGTRRSISVTGGRVETEP